MHDELHSNVVFKIISAEESSSAIDLYSQWGYDWEFNKKEKVLCSFYKGEAIGVVRISKEGLYHVLRGMFISEQYRRKRVGELMLLQAEPILNQTISYCIPNLHLIPFYNHISFYRIKPENAPGFLQRRLEVYLIKYPDLIIMERNPK